MRPTGLSREQQEWAVERLQRYFQDERDEELTHLAATLLLDFVTEHLGPLYYNQGLADAQALVRRVAIGIDEDLEAAKRPTPERGPGGR